MIYHGRAGLEEDLESKSQLHQDNARLTISENIPLKSFSHSNI